MQSVDEDRGKVVTRVAGEYTQLVYLVTKARAERCAIVDSVTQVRDLSERADIQRIEAIKTALSQDLSTILVEAVQKASVSLRQCLRTYELIEGWEEAEEVVRTMIRAFCRQVRTSR